MKKLEPRKNEGHNPYIAIGEILQIKKKDYLIIDCNIPIYISYGLEDFSIGEYIEVKGRLDARKN